MKDWRRTHYSEEISPEMEGSEVVVAGWIHETRDLGGVAFVVLRDRAGKIQVTIPKKKVDEELAEKIISQVRETVVMVRGTVQKDERAPGNFELIPNDLKILSKSKTPLPMDVSGKVDAELDTRLNSRYMDLRKPEIGAVFKIRSKTLTEVRNYLENQGFLEITTPKMVATATEGGTDLFPISYFEKEAFLNQSPQLFKQMMMASGLDKVYEIGPIFRAEEHDTRRHLNESISIDVEQAFSDHNDVMQLLEDMIQHITEKVKKDCGKELQTLNHDLEIPETPFERVKYEEAIELAGEKGVDVVWGDDLPTPGEKAVGEEIGTYYYITEWPSEIKPFYALPEPENKEITRAFDLMHPRFELSSGAQRVHQIDLLEKRMTTQGLAPENFEFYIDSFKYGMPPHAGWGVGAERLLMALTGKENIREVTLFPRDRNRLTP
ncbi:aspartate--tRNA(Asn) ligase [Methanonatronarchaeum thermophilum]|nr:aspartate--tRNA(Asn) ligase [Methanonatronarchaeum thermophilum]